MISVANIIRQVRVDVKDINEVKYSDWDLENSLNKALRLTANHFAMRNSDFMERSIVMLDEPLKLRFAPKIAEGIADELHGDSLPKDFISLMAHASFVIACSFHGTAFSINFNKPFVSVVPLNEEYSAQVSAPARVSLS